MYRNAPEFKQTISKPKRVGPEFNPWFWHPYNPIVTFAPSDFRTRLKKEMGEELEITWNPITERWQVWSKAPKINHPICQGWRLLFVHHGAAHQYLPLDERVFARLYQASIHEHGSARAYFDRIVSEMERDQEKKEKRLQQEAIDQAMPFFDHSQISISMCGKSNGSKFSTYHA